MRAREQGGSATVELALALPSLVALLALTIALAVGGAGAAACQRAAGAAVRVAAMGDVERAQAVAATIAGPGTITTLAFDSGWVSVDLECPVRLPVGASTATARATAPLEMSVGTW